MTRDTIAAVIHARCLGTWETEPERKSINHDASVHHREAELILALSCPHCTAPLAEHGEFQPYAVWKDESGDTFFQVHP